MRLIFVVILFLFSSLPAYAADYSVDYTKSHIIFKGKHATNDFQGQFENWTANVSFDLDNPSNSKISATFVTNSAKTGDALYDGTLPQKDWFASKEYPEAHFESNSISKKTENQYVAKGSLTIRDITRPISFPFTLEPLDGGEQKAIASFIINRLDFNIGKESDPNTEWVDQDITVELEIFAKQTY